jgi:iron(III) transport system ATP-binding protein
VADRIVVTNLSKVYPGGAQALRDVSLEVAPGTFLVLLGPSGSGKTTLLRCLAGIERASSGRIVIGGVTVADELRHLPPERRGLSMVFQDYALWPHLTVHDNVAFALRRQRYSRDARRRQADAMLERVGLAQLAARYPNELSGGEQQRVALARALVAGTGLILCDEPLSNLDADLRERMRVEISALVRGAGATTVYITHDQAEAFALADRIGILDRGRLVQAGTPEEIYSAPATPFVARFTGLAGELPVRVRRQCPDGTVEVEPGGGTGARPGRPLRASAPRGTVRPGPALLAVRPAGVQLCLGDDGEHHLSGTVTDVAFRGRGYDHAIDVPGHGRLTGVFASTRVARGQTVGLRLAPQFCHVFAGPAADSGTDSSDGRFAEPAGAPGPAR